ncbi:MAG: nitroreductase family protein [Deltaproteobacteria bacterium]|nr:nitroreductase family protein [Deltaproteobacteria bacterium]
MIDHPSRLPDADVDPLFPGRWSPRSFAPDPIPRPQLLALFEAARWAPSARNEQPWRFLYADTPETLALFRLLLVDSNRAWADRAPVLVFVLARRHFLHNGRPNPTAAFDTGAAWMALALQARLLGLHTHPMAGIHHDQAYETLGVPRDDFELLAAVAIGHLAPPDLLPPDLRAREVPSSRLALASIATPGPFSA